MPARVASELRVAATETLEAVEEPTPAEFVEAEAEPARDLTARWDDDTCFTSRDRRETFDFLVAGDLVAVERTATCVAGLVAMMVDGARDDPEIVEAGSADTPLATAAGARPSIPPDRLSPNWDVPFNSVGDAVS